MSNPYIKQYLMTAGPTPLPPAVSQVMAEPILYHRAPAFVEIYERVLERLPQIFRSSNDVLCFASTGSGALESAVANLVRPGHPALVASCGKFGERWAELCEAFGADLTHGAFEWGAKVDPARVDEVLDSMAVKPDVVFTTQSETSTGVLNDVAALAEVARSHGAILVVDAVSGLGAAELLQDEWGVDVVVSGSQKSLMCPPGLGFASVSQRALDLAAASPGGRYYFDWAKTAAGQRKSPPDSPFTTAVTLFRGLDVALEAILAEGLDEVFARHAILARAARAGIEGLGLRRFGPDDPDANAVTAAHLPDGIDGARVPKTMRDVYGVTAAGGQGHLKGRIVRLAHCGYYGAFDIVVAITALESALRDVGHECDPGAGVAAVQRILIEAGSPAPVG